MESIVLTEGLLQTGLINTHSSHLFPSTHAKINACISLQASGLKADSGDGNSSRVAAPTREDGIQTQEYAQFQSNMRSHTHACSSHHAVYAQNQTSHLKKNKKKQGGTNHTVIL